MKKDIQDNNDNLPLKDNNDENNNNINNNKNDKEGKKKNDITDWEVSVADLREIVATKIDQEVLDTYRYLLYQHISISLYSS